MLDVGISSLHSILLLLLSCKKLGSLRPCSASRNFSNTHVKPISYKYSYQTFLHGPIPRAGKKSRSNCVQLYRERMHGRVSLDEISALPHI